MKRVSVLLAVVVALFWAVFAAMGYEATYQLAYGAFTLMAAMISLTFLWLWAVRATPLALGMSFSWAGAASVVGWWWVYNLLSQPAIMRENEVLFVFLSFYFVGAILHFAVIERSFRRDGALFVIPVLISLAVSAAIRLAF